MTPAHRGIRGGRRRRTRGDPRSSRRAQRMAGLRRRHPLASMSTVHARHGVTPSMRDEDLAELREPFDEGEVGGDATRLMLSKVGWPFDVVCQLREEFLGNLSEEKLGFRPGSTLASRGWPLECGAAGVLGGHGPKGPTGSTPGRILSCYWYGTRSLGRAHCRCGRLGNQAPAGRLGSRSDDLAASASLLAEGSAVHDFPDSYSYTRLERDRKHAAARIGRERIAAGGRGSDHGGYLHQLVVRHRNSRSKNG